MGRLHGLGAGRDVAVGEVMVLCFSVNLETRMAPERPDRCQQRDRCDRVEAGKVGAGPDTGTHPVWFRLAGLVRGAPHHGGSAGEGVASLAETV